ncbi:leucine-rich repeat domain-containing protein, partial [Bacteroidales bacterium OttesenSCG-928-B11]|nr:leucine-rich repeat domain-containing protein [Bacteroidales bacterium OttesenSCG-928-B11]
QFNTVIIEEGVQSIGEFAFLARSAYSIVIANSVEKYSPWAFAWSELISITNLNPIPVKISRDVFVTVDIAACTLKVPRNSVALYKRTDVWREFYILDLDGNEVEIDTELEDGSLLIYPNPSAGSCRVVIPEIFLGEPLLTLSIYDLSGVLLQQITVPKGNEEIIVDLELKAQGVYVVVMSNGEKSRKGKIMFE